MVSKEHKKWLPKEEDYLKKANKQRISLKEQCEDLGCTITQLTYKRGKLGLTRKVNKKWSDEDIEKIIQWDKEGIMVKEQAKRLGFKEERVSLKRQALGLVEKRTNHLAILKRLREQEKGIEV